MTQDSEAGLEPTTLSAMPIITRLRSRDVRFSLGKGEGTDAVHE